MFRRNGMDTGLQPFFAKYLECNQDEEGNVKSSENCIFEGFECGYYYPSFTINKEIWEKAYSIMPKSYTKNIVEIL